MALKSIDIQLTDKWQLIIDNSGDNASENNNIYINSGFGYFRFDTDTPTEEKGMVFSAGMRNIFVPVGSKLYGKKSKTDCLVIANIEQ